LSLAVVFCAHDARGGRVPCLAALLGWWLSLFGLVPVAAGPLPQAGADTRWLVAYTSPSGAQFQADERLDPALDILAGVPEGRPLLDAPAQGRVLVIFAADDLVDEYVYYDDTLRLISVDPSLREIDARALAALLAREATHAQRDLDGSAEADAITRGEVEACIRDEVAATRAEMDVWHRVMGTEGLSTARHPYGVQLNDDLAESLGAAELFVQHVRRDAVAQCRD
jgi:hypothetical protein